MCMLLQTVPLKFVLLKLVPLPLQCMCTKSYKINLQELKRFEICKILHVKSGFSKTNTKK